MKTKKNLKPVIRAAGILGAWAGFGLLITLIFGPKERGHFDVEILSPVVEIGQISVSESTILSFLVTGLLTVAAILFKILCVPRFSQIPNGIQNAMELAVSKLDEFTHERAGMGGALSAYILALAAFLMGCSVLEMFGIRSPSSDILVTFSLALITLFLINYCAIRKKGVIGRIKHYISPTPLIAPIKLLTDLAIPISLSCRLFGNMLAGLIIMELLYFALGNFAVGPPAALGLYFNVFHPLIQAFVFITLTLSFIGEAVEIPEK